MIAKLMIALSDLLQRSGKWIIVAKITLFTGAFFPICLVIFLNYQSDVRDAQTLVLSQHRSVTHLAATILKGKLDGYVGLGTSLASQDDVKKNILEGNWDAAMQEFIRTQKVLPDIDGILLFDVAGNLKSGTPPVPEIVNENFAFRDYFLGVSKKWEPYVSDVYTRAQDPKYNIIAVAVPILAPNEATADPQTIGILLFTIKLDSILSWGQEINVGSSGFTYFVDRQGNVAGHQKYSNASAIINYAAIPAVQRVILGEAGVQVDYNTLEQSEQIIGYEPLEKYGWSAITQQPANEAFAFTTHLLRQALLEDIILASISAILFFFILQLMFSIRAYHQKERAFLESVGDGLIGIDRFWNITLWNKAATALTGRTEEEAMGKPFPNVVEFADEASHEKNIAFIEESMLFGKTRIMGSHTVLRRKTGEEIPVNDSVAPIFDERGLVDGAMIIFRDASKDRELQKSREEFSSLATHQLRTPITVINQFSELLAAEPTLTPTGKEEVAAIQKASSSLTELVTAMLNVSRIESGSIGITPTLLLIPDVAKQVAKEMESQFTKKKLKLTQRYSKDVAAIDADENLVSAIVKNLLSNALKFTPEGGEVTLSVNKNATDVVLNVIDTGMGIPKSEQNQIFTKFYRANNVRVADISGTGLGLYTIKAILKQSGGRIWFESEENHGSSFHVSIPLSGMVKKEGMKGLT